MSQNDALQNDLVQNLRVGTPCPMKWDDLEGQGAKRWCGECRLNVFDFSQMTGGEIGDLVANTEGRLCGRMVRRGDGTVVTKDCGPVRSTRRRLGRVAALLAATLAPFGLVACTQGTVESGGVENGGGETPAPSVDTPELPPLLGEVCVPEELGDVVYTPAQVEELTPLPQELLGRIALPETSPAPTEDDSSE